MIANYMNYDVDRELLGVDRELFNLTAEMFPSKIQKSGKHVLLFTNFANTWLCLYMSDYFLGGRLNKMAAFV